LQSPRFARARANIVTAWTIDARFVRRRRRGEALLGGGRLVVCDRGVIVDGLGRRLLGGSVVGRFIDGRFIDRIVHRIVDRVVDRVLIGWRWLGLVGLVDDRQLDVTLDPVQVA
jgi:hypothetical protein